jgi:hypothetical protein
MNQIFRSQYTGRQWKSFEYDLYAKMCNLEDPQLVAIAVDECRPNMQRQVAFEIVERSLDFGSLREAYAVAAWSREVAETASSSYLSGRAASLHDHTLRVIDDMEAEDAKYSWMHQCFVVA